MKAFYFVITDAHKWGRGTELKEAMKAAGLTKLPNKTKFAIYIGVCKKETTEEQLSNLVTYWNVDNYGGLNAYESSGSKEAIEEYEADKQMIKECFVGWITEESYIK